MFIFVARRGSSDACVKDEAPGPAEHFQLDKREQVDKCEYLGLCGLWERLKVV